MDTANHRRGALSLALGAGVLLFAVPALADDPLAEVATMVRELRYEAALERTEAVRQDDSTAPDVRLRAIELSAVAHLGLGDESAARMDFTRLLTLDPGYNLSDPRPSPRIVEVFQAARGAVRAEGTPESLFVSASTSAGNAGPVQVSARPDGEHAIVRVSFRSTLDGTTRDVEAVRRGPPWRAVIPVPDRRAALRLEVVARGYGPSGRLAAVSAVGRIERAAGDDPAALGAGSEGTTDEEPAEGSGGIAGKWWFWTVVGVVVAGGTVTAIALTSSGTDPARSGDLGTLTLR